jgi:hypothetical protein
MFGFVDLTISTVDDLSSSLVSFSSLVNSCAIVFDEVPKESFLLGKIIIEHIIVLNKINPNAIAEP